MAISKYVEREFYIPLDAKTTEDLLMKHYDNDSLEEIEAIIKKTFRSRQEVVKIIETVLHFDLQYGLLVLAYIFTELFNNKRFVTRIRNYLK